MVPICYDISALTDKFSANGTYSNIFQYSGVTQRQALI